MVDRAVGFQALGELAEIGSDGGRGMILPALRSRSSGGPKQQSLIYTRCTEGLRRDKTQEYE